MKIKRLALLALTLGLGMACSHPASAQMGGPDDGPPAGPGGFDANGPNGNQPMPSNFGNQGQMRQLLTAAGLSADQMATVTNFVQVQETARQSLRQRMQRISPAILSEMTDADFTTTWNNFLDAVTAEQSRTNAAQRQLDAQIGFSKNARLEAALNLLGVLGDLDILQRSSSGSSGFGSQGFGGQGFGTPGAGISPTNPVTGFPARQGAGIGR